MRSVKKAANAEKIKTILNTLCFDAVQEVVGLTPLSVRPKEAALQDWIKTKP